MQQVCQVSFAQQRLWFLEQLSPGNCAYNLVSAIRIRGLLDVEALGRTLQAVVQRHDSLRTTFTAVNGEAVALISPVDETKGLPVVSLDHLPANQGEAHALVLAAEEGQRPFDLTAGPLFRTKLLRLSSIEHILVLTMHHIVMDGWSIKVLLEEMALFYDAFHSNQSPNIPPLPIRYGDFVSWQREYFTGETEAGQLKYWKQTLSGVPAVLELPADRLRPAVQSHNGRRHCVHLDAKIAKDVSDLSRKEGITPFIVLLSAFQTLLWRYTGVSDFVLGTPMAGRSLLELEPLIGLFVNTIPLRADLSGDPTFRDLLHRVRNTVLDATEHQDVPFEKLVEELRPERSLSHTPLFQTMFVFHNCPRLSLDFGGLHLDELELDCGLAKFDLTLEIYELDGLSCSWEYSTDLFDQQRIARMAGHFETLLRGICAEPGCTLSGLPVLGEKERNQVLVEWNATASPFPDRICIHEAFEAQAKRSPDLIAVRAEDRHLTYKQLNDEANCLSNYLRRHGVEPQDRVGVAIERSADAIVALLAVMKTGASYVPIDPSYPKQRIDFMLKDCSARILITQDRLRVWLPDHGGEAIYLDRDRSTILAQSPVNPVILLDSGCPAYVIYTSGSTGNPKGVLGTHRASMNRFAWMWKTYPFGAEEVCAQRTSLSFVDSIAEIFGPLLQGVPICIMSDEAAIDGDEFAGQLTVHQITRVVVVPSQLAAILDGCTRIGTRLPDLRLCFTSGEALPYSLYERFHRLVPHAALVNLYGSSEVGADVTCFDSSLTPPSGFVPIGKPIANVRIYLLDPFLNPVPIGVPGEIYVSGDCLARGYLDRSELNAQRFVADPFRPGERLYKMGDLGRYHDDGNIEFLGRSDNQVKIRGFRIELGEIEAALRAHGSVHDAAVVVRMDRTADHYLVAYVVPNDGEVLVHSELRRHLKTVLPEYMVPAAYITLDALPMTPNGKLDQRALPALDPARPLIPNGCLGPRNELEKSLIAIWAEVLRIDRIGVLDNFFELGGHSLLATQVIARVRKHLGVEVPVRSLFEEPTVAGLANTLERIRANGAMASAFIAPGRPARRTRQQLEARLRDLSEEEIDALLTMALAHRAQGDG